jgi:hypothetical protein
MRLNDKSSIQCPECGCAIPSNIDDDGYNILVNEFPNLHEIVKGRDGPNTYFVVLGPSFSITFDFNPDGKKWRIKDAWIETKDMTITFFGNRIWRDGPRRAISAAFTTRKSLVEDL